MLRFIITSEVMIMGLSFQNYGEERDIICTEEERKIFGAIYEAFMKNDGVEPDDVRLVRVSDNYVTIRFLGWDLMRLKFTNRAKWICFPLLDSVHHKIEFVSDVFDYDADIQDAANKILKYSNE